MRNFIHFALIGCCRLLGVAVVMGFAMQAASATCSNLSFNSIPSTVAWVGGTGSGYNPFDPSDRVQSVTLTVKKTSGTCTYVIGATTGGGDTFTSRTLTGGGSTLSFNLFTTSTRTNVIKDLPNATSSDVIAGSFTQSGSQTNTHTLFYDITAQQVVAPATYSRSMQMKLYQGNVSNGTLSQSANVNYTASVSSTAELSLIASGGAFDSSSTTQSLDLGSMTSTQSLGFDMRARGNAGFDIQLQSQNSGTLHHSDPTVTDTVAYVMTVSGSTINLSGGQTVKITGPTSKTTLTGNVFPVVVTVGPQTGTAGTYSDVISVTVVSH